MKKVIPIAGGDLVAPAQVEIPILLNADELAAYLARVHDAHDTLAHIHGLQRRVAEQQQQIAHN